MPSASSSSFGQRHLALNPIDDSYTVLISEAAQLLDCSEADVVRLIEYSRVNAKSGIQGPLTVRKSQGVTLNSVLAYRSAKTPSSRTV